MSIESDRAKQRKSDGGRMDSVNILLCNSLISPFSRQDFREQCIGRRNPVPLCTSNSEKIFVKIRALGASSCPRLKQSFQARILAISRESEKNPTPSSQAILTILLRIGVPPKTKNSGVAHTQNPVYAYTTTFRDFRTQAHPPQQLRTIVAKPQSTFSYTNSDSKRI